MLCWPFFAEQQTNCWFCVNKWRIELIEGEKGKQMKNKAMEWKFLGENASIASAMEIEFLNYFFYFFYS
ncbi:hypothetical protein ACOSP7_012786 [Xanthoceras sorbifolium]